MNIRISIIVGEAWYPRGTASAWWQRDSKMNESNSNLKTVMDFDLTFTCQKRLEMHVLAVKDSKQGYLKFMKLSHRIFIPGS